MRRPLLVNSTLLLLAMVLAVAVWLTMKQPEQEQKITLTRLMPDRITRVIIEHGSDTTYLVRGPEGWIINQPSETKADQAKIENLLQIAQSISIRNFAAPQELTEFGLNPPQAVLTLNQTRIEMGALHPINQRRYIRVGNLIHLTNDRFFHLLQSAPKSLTPQTNEKR